MLSTIFLAMTIAVAHRKYNSTILLRAVGVVMFMSLYGITMPEQGGDVSAWDWFSWAKRASLFIAYGAYCLMNTFRGGKTNASRYAGLFMQIMLCANVAEAAVMTCTYDNDWPYVRNTIFNSGYTDVC